MSVSPSPSELLVPSKDTKVLPEMLCLGPALATGGELALEAVTRVCDTVLALPLTSVITKLAT